jgi:hypothetical protein
MLNVMAISKIPLLVAGKMSVITLAAASPSTLKLETVLMSLLASQSMNTMMVHKDLYESRISIQLPLLLPATAITTPAPQTLSV